MSNNFDWRTDEEIDWDDLSALPESAPPPMRRRIYWFVALAVLLLAVAGLWLVRQVNDELSEVTAQVEADVRTIHALVYQAAAREDVDVVSTILSARDRAWTNSQLELVEKGEFVHRQALGLTAVAPGSTDVLTVTVAPNLKAAEVTAVHDYTTQTPDGDTQTIQLLQTSIYRMGYRNWLFSPPLDDYWGSTPSYQGRYLTLLYPERDAELATRLAADLDDLLGRMCATVADLNCPAAYRVRLRFETDAALLQTVLNPPALLKEGNRLSLPTPSLVGQPIDEAGYAALFRGYATQLASAAIADLVGYDCCIQVPYFTVLLDWQLSDLALQPWPPEAIDYQALQENWVGDSTLNTLWGRQSVRGTTDLFKLHLYSLVDMMVQDAVETPPPAAMLRALNGAEDYHDWLRAIVDDRLTGELLLTKWAQFVFAQAGVSTVVQPSPPFPAGVVEMVCNTNSEQAQVVAYNPATGEWGLSLAADFAEGRLGWLNPLPIPNTYALYTYDEETNGNYPQNLTVELWQDGRLLLTTYPEENDESVIIYAPSDFTQSQPQTRYLALSHYSDSNPRYGLLDLEACRQGDCESLPLPGFPVISPDASQMLLSMSDGLPSASTQTMAFPPLLLANPANLAQRQTLGYGRSAIWLTADRYVFLRPLDDSEPSVPVGTTLALVTATVDQPTPEVLLTTDDVSDFLPDLVAPTRMTLYVPQVLAEGRRLLVEVEDGGANGLTMSYMLMVDLTPSLTAVADITLIASGYNGRRSPIQSAPNGDWLSYFDYTHNELHIINTTTSSVLVFDDDINTFAWVGDSYLVVSRFADLQFVSPEGDFELTVPHGFGFCWDMQWKPAP